MGVQPEGILLPPTADQGPIGRHDLRVDERCDELTGKGEPEQDESYPRPPGSPSPEPPLNLRLARPTLHAPRCLDRGVIETHCRDHAKAQSDQIQRGFHLRLHTVVRAVGCREFRTGVEVILTSG